MLNRREMKRGLLGYLGLDCEGHTLPAIPSVVPSIFKNGLKKTSLFQMLSDF